MTDRTFAAAPPPPPCTALARWCCIASLALGSVVSAQTTAPTLQLLAPSETQTAREFVNVLGRTTPGTAVWVAGEPAAVFSTGVFVRDRVPLAMGINRLTLDWQGSDGSRQSQTLPIERVPPPAAVQWPADALFLDGSSLRPQDPVRVAPGEGVEVAVRATPARQVWARLPAKTGAAAPGQPTGAQKWQPLQETAPGRYRARLVFDHADDAEPAAVQVRVQAAGAPDPNSRSARPGRMTGRTGPRMVAQPDDANALVAQTPGVAGQWRHDPERLVRVGPEGAELLHGLHDVRLGGPFLAEMAPGVLLSINGQQGEYWRVQLSADTVAWVPQRAVTAVAPGTAAPSTSFTSMAVSGSVQGSDVLRVALPISLPVAVRAVTGAQGQHSLELDVFGAHHASTWITHRANSTLVQEVSAEQAGPGRVRVRLALRGERLWGWRLERSEQTLQLHVMPRPRLAALQTSPPAPAAGLPLAGLRVALEPGHGGATNLGAVGATGVPEKDINRWTVQALQTELQAAGADVVVVRDNDDNPPLRERARRVMDSQAHVFLSVHANASDTSNGYLRVSGTSTYYKHAQGRDLAAAIQTQTLEQSGLTDFGLIGNFNYTPLRLVTTMPAALVELAFMSHPGDEAKLLDPDFRALMARAVRQGLEAFLRAR